MIENTSKRDPLLHYIGAESDGITGYITGMEAAGQRQVVTSTKLPTEGSEGLVALGFTLGEVDPRDPLFREVTLPPGWSKQATDHSMHSDVVDQHGRARVGVFYKAAFYDRRADCHVIGLHAYLWSVADGEPLVLDDVWATRDAVAATLRKMIAKEDEQVTFWQERGRTESVAQHEKSRARYQKILDGLPTVGGESA